MKPAYAAFRLIHPWVLALCALLLLSIHAHAQTDPLPSWNDGPAKKAIIDFVQATADKSNPKFVAPEARIATFDQDGTTWVSHPMYTQVVYCLERVAVLAKAKPELNHVEPFKTVLSGNRDSLRPRLVHILFVQKWANLGNPRTATGFLIDPLVFARSIADNFLLVAAIIGALVAGKWIAAEIVGHAFAYTSAARLTMWSLTLPQVAATLAAAIVAFHRLNAAGQRLIDGQTLNAVLVLLPTTAILGPVLTQRLAPRMLEEASA